LFAVSSCPSFHRLRFELRFSAGRPSSCGDGSTHLRWGDVAQQEEIGEDGPEIDAFRLSSSMSADSMSLRPARHHSATGTPQAWTAMSFATASFIWKFFASRERRVVVGVRKYTERMSQVGQ